MSICVDVFPVQHVYCNNSCNALNTKYVLCILLGGSIEYSVVSGDPNNYFTIDSGSGEIRTGAAINYETTSSVLLNIQAQSGNPPTFGHAQVNNT